MTATKLTKLATGIPGFDAITNGGLPEGCVTLLLGGAGSGKTVFALQTLTNAARTRGEPGIFVTFEEPSNRVIANVETFGWDIPELVDKAIFFLDSRLSPEHIICGQFDLTGLLAGLEAKAKQMGARWIVFDSIDALLAMLNDHALEMREMYRLREWLAETGLTGIITAKLDEAWAFRMRYSSLQFLADCSVRLENRLFEQVSLRELRVIKYRGSAFSENVAYFVFGAKGIVVADVTIGEETPAVGNERVSSGVARLDTMLSGGFYRGSSILLTGLPGTAKTTLASAFAEAACKQGERVVYCAFDEPPAEIVRNLASVDIRLAPHVEAGRLVMVESRTDSGSSEEHFIKILALINEHNPTCLVADPFSTLMYAGGNILATSVVRRLVALAKRKGITLLLTVLQEAGDYKHVASHLHVSTIADTWINITYNESAGERNRALSIIKSRGTAHSNQVRELILSNGGVTLNDVYAASGNVLMGTLRWEFEERERLENLRAAQSREAKRREMELALEEAQNRLLLLQHELELRRADLDFYQAETAAISHRQQEMDKARGQLRGAD
jgi:circadian clock protein KaiC